MTAPSSNATQRLLVPIHTDNWALALASGYVGTAVQSDRAIDVQVLAAGSVLAFQGQIIPRWAMEYGDQGPRVVLEIEGEHLTERPASEPLILSGPIRVTQVLVARFASEDERRNFVASYTPFPDVPVKLVETAIGGFAIADVPAGTPPSRRDLTDLTPRRNLEYLGGWAGGLVEALLEGSHDQAIQQHLRDAGSSPFELATSLLRNLHPAATELDHAIWGTVVEVLSERAAARGFDKGEVLQEIGARLSDRTRDSEGAQSWVATCRKVVHAIVDPPSLDDQKRIGQRAGLASLLAHDVRSATSLGETLNAGPVVQLLAMVAAHAFEGLSRLSGRLKGEPSQLNAILDIAEGIGSAGSINISFSRRQFDSALAPHDSVIMKEGHAFTRSLQPRSYELILRARASEAGFDLKVDPNGGGMFLATPANRRVKIFVDEDPSSTAEHPVIRFVRELAPIGTRPNKKFQAYLETAWAIGCGVGVKDAPAGKVVCAFVTQPTATLDRDEFSFHIGRLILFKEAIRSLATGLKAADSVIQQPGKLS